MHKIKLFFYIFILFINIFIINIFTNNAMQVKQYINLPAELWAYIMFFAIQTETPEQAINNIKAISHTNKTFNIFLKDSYFLNNIFNNIAQRFNINKAMIEAMFGTQQVRNHFKKVLETWQLNPDLREDIIKSIILNDNPLLLIYFIKNGVDTKTISATKIFSNSLSLFDIPNLSDNALTFAIKKNRLNIVSILAGLKIFYLDKILEEIIKYYVLQAYKFQLKDIKMNIRDLKVAQILILNGAKISKNLSQMLPQRLLTDLKL